MKRWLTKILIGGTLLSGGLGAPVIPNGEMELLYSYQYPVADWERVQAKNTEYGFDDVNQPRFEDTNGDGIISVSKFRDSNGKHYWEQINETTYQKMGERGGSVFNPTKQENISLFGTLFLQKADAAIALDASAGDDATATSLTYSHTVTGSDTILFVGTFDPNSFVTGITYNSVALSQTTETDGDASGNYSSLWMLVAPTSGANNVVISRSDSDGIRGRSSSFTGAKQTGQPDASASADANSSTTGVDVSITVVAADSWIASYCYSNQNAAAHVNGTNFTVRATTGLDNFSISDSNAALSAGAKTVSCDNDGSSSNFGINSISFSPAAAAAAGGVPPQDLITFTE